MRASRLSHGHEAMPRRDVAADRQLASRCITARVQRFQVCATWTAAVDKCWKPATLSQRSTMAQGRQSTSQHSSGRLREGMKQTIMSAKSR